MHIAHPPTVKAWISHKANARHITWSKSVKCTTDLCIAELCRRCAKLCKRRSCGYNNRRQSPLLRVNAGPDDRRCVSRWFARLRCFYSVKSLIGKQVRTGGLWWNKFFGLKFERTFLKDTNLLHSTLLHRIVLCWCCVHCALWKIVLGGMFYVFNICWCWRCFCMKVN